MQAFVGTVVDTPMLGQLRVRPHHVILVDERGIISSIEDEYLPSLDNIPKDRIHRLDEGDFLLPSFTDLHLHAPQYLYAGTGLDLPLMEWLDKYAYRAEEMIDANEELATKVYKRLCERLIEVGTGCVVLFGTIGVKSNLILAKAFQEAGLRALVGKLSMDQSPRPTYGESSSAASLDSLNEFLNGMDQLIANVPSHQRLVQPIITPRFVPVCSDVLLAKLAQVAEEKGVRVQSHMCESRDQMNWVEGSRGKKDEEVFDQVGLLRKGTVQAHVTSLPPSLIDLCKARGVIAAHCPLSNAYFSDAQFPLREALDAEMSIGLGSDISGGYALSIQTSMRSAVYTARLREGQRRELAHARRTEKNLADEKMVIEKKVVAMQEVDEEKGLRVDWKESLWVATRGGKGALDMGGVFEVGMEFDAQQISLRSDGRGVGALDFFDGLSAKPSQEWWMEAVERWWCNGDERNRVGMWIQGRRLR